MNVWGTKKAFKRIRGRRPPYKAFPLFHHGHSLNTIQNQRQSYPFLLLVMLQSFFLRLIVLSVGFSCAVALDPEDREFWPTLTVLWSRNSSHNMATRTARLANASQRFQKGIFNPGTETQDRTAAESMMISQDVKVNMAGKTIPFKGEFVSYSVTCMVKADESSWQNSISHWIYWKTCSNW